MNKIDGESISALLDGEVPQEAHRRTVSNLLEDGKPALDTYGRYRLIGDLMRDESARIVSVADAVHTALRDEPTIMAPPARQRARWMRPAAGLAVAASVAAAAVMVAPRLIEPEPLAPQSVAMAPSLPVVSPQLVAAGPAAGDGSAAAGAGRWQALDPDLEDRLNRLVIEHHEFGGRTGVNGPVPHIGFVSYGAR